MIQLVFEDDPGPPYDKGPRRKATRVKGSPMHVGGSLTAEPLDAPQNRWALRS